MAPITTTSTPRSVTDAPPNPGTQSLAEDVEMHDDSEALYPLRGVRAAHGILLSFSIALVYPHSAYARHASNTPEPFSHHWLSLSSTGNIDLCLTSSMLAFFSFFVDSRDAQVNTLLAYQTTRCCKTRNNKVSSSIYFHAEEMCLTIVSARSSFYLHTFFLLPPCFDKCRHRSVGTLCFASLSKPGRYDGGGDSAETRSSGKNLSLKRRWRSRKR